MKDGKFASSKTPCFSDFRRKNIPGAMKSQHLAGFDPEVEDAKCVVLRQVFHTHGLENPDFIVVLGIQRENNSPLSAIAPPTALRPSAPSAPLEKTEYVKDR